VIRTFFIKTRKYLDYYRTAIQLKGPKGDGDMQSEKLSKYLVMWAADRFKRDGR